MRVAAAVLLVLAESASADTCGRSSTGPLVDISPQCFEECPGLCGQMGRLLAGRGSRDPLAKVCTARPVFECATGAEACGPVLRAASNLLGVTLPQTPASLAALCEDEAAGGGDDDVSDGNTTTIAPATRRLSDGNTTTTMPPTTRRSTSTTVMVLLGRGRDGWGEEASEEMGSVHV